MSQHKTHRLTEAQINTMIDRAVKQALAEIGLSDDKVKIDIHDLRSLLQAINTAKRTAWQTFIRVITTGLLLAMMAGVAMKLKIFGGQGC